MNKTKLFSKKESMTGTTKNNVMKHLPTPQPNRSRFAMVFLLFMTFLLGNVPSWGQVTTLSNWQNQYHNTATSQQTIAYTIPAGSGTNRVLAVAIASSQSSVGARTVAVTYGGQTLTLAAGDMATTSTRQHTAIYYLKESGLDAATNTNLVFTVSGGTTRVTDVWTAAFDYVDQTTPITNTQNYNSIANTTSALVFGTAMTINSGDQAVLVASSLRSGSTTPRTFTSATNFTSINEQTWTTTDGVRNALFNRAVPTAGANSTCSTTISNSTLGSMTGVSFKGCTPATVNVGTALTAICLGGTSAGLGGSVGGSATGGTWTSSVSGGTFSPNASTLNATWTPPSNYTGTVTLTLTSSGGSCGTASNSKTLVVNPNPTAVTASASVSSICAGASLNLLSNATSNSGLSTSTLLQDFNTTISPWTSGNASTGGTVANADWTLRASGYNDGNETFTTTDGSQFIISSSDAQGSGGTTNTTLVSNSFSTVGSTAASINLEHYYRFNSGTDDRAFVEVSSDNSNWTTLTTYSSTQGSPSAFSTTNIALTNTFLNQANVYVRLRYTGSFDWYWAINNVRISRTFTSAPSATFAWTSSPAGYTSDLQNPTSVAPVENTTYTVTATNSYGCSASASASVTVNSSPNATYTGITSNQNLCQGVTYALTPITSGGSWSTNANPSSLLTFIGNTVGITEGVTVGGNPATITYTTPVVNGCSATSSISVFLRPTPGAPNLSASQNFCEGATVASISASGAAVGATLTWYTQNTGSSEYSSGTALSNNSSYYASQTLNSCESSSRTMVTATVNPLPSAPTAVDNSRCGTGTVSISGTVGAEETIDWYSVSTGGTVLAGGSGATSYTTPSISATTIYYAQARNIATGCSSLTRTAVTAIVNSIPTITATANLAVCPGENVTLSGNGGSTYVWDNGISNGISFVPVVTTTYTVTGTAANGCTNTASSTVTVNPVPTVTNASICAGGSGSLSVTSSCNDLTGQTSGPRDATSGANVTGVGTLAWTNPGNIAGAGTAGMSVAANTVTNYLRGTNYGFSIPTNAIINGIQLSISRSSSSTSTTTNLRDEEVKLVKNGTIQATNKATTTLWGNLATASYGGNADLWSGTWTASDINNSNFGAVLSIRNTNTNTTSRTAAVDFMRITVTYTIPGESNLNWYTVSSGGSVISIGSTLNPVGVANSGLADSNTPGTTSYYVSCSTAAGACRAQANFEIKEAPTATIAAGSATTFCEGESVVLSANTGTGLTYLWNNNETTSSITVSNSGSYTVTVTNANDCSATSTATAVTVNPIVTPTFTQVETICSGASLSALPTESNNNIAGTWSPEVNNTATTEYTFTPTAGQCALTTTMTITVTPTINYYADADGDGYGNASSVQAACSQPAGYVSNNTDCNDANISISPMAEELCDGIDNDCNASTVDGLGTTTYFRDLDGDTFGNPNVTTVNCQAPVGYVADNTDCDDSNATYHVINTYFEDNDNDTFGNEEAAIEACFAAAGYTVNHDDCDDTNASVNPNATEICNLIDDDCDGEINDGLTSVDYHFDGDGDGFGSGTATLLCAPTAGYVQNSADCNDNNALVYPGATEICGNAIDEDCAAGDLVPDYYISVQSGPWALASTWNISCDNNTYTAANYAPAVGYYGIVTVDAGHTVTVEVNNGQIASTRNLNINASGTLVVNGKMSVAQTMVNNGTLTVNHGASFLQSSTTAVNSGSGSYVVNMNLTGTSNGSAPNGRYWYVGSPMNNTNVSNTFYNASTMTRVWSYATATNSWSAIINSSTGFGQGSATTMAVGVGYLYRAGSAQSVTFNGTSSTFNNNITTPLSFTGTGYKFVSNPYTSHVDWKLVTRTGLNVSYWIRNSTNTNYESYNATSGVSNSPSGQTTKDIPPMQGFYVYSFAATSSLRIDNGDRVHATNVLHAPMHNQVVRLNLNDGKTYDQAVVYENENASNGIEEFDTDKFMDENHHQVYFLEGTKEVSLDGLKDATAKQKVDMGIQITSAGTYTINAVELGVEEDVMLEDKFTHTFQDMKRNNTYSFTSNAGTYNNRFVLHFTLNPQTETSMESVAVTEEATEVEGVSVYTTTGQQVKIWVTNNTYFQNATVKVYDAIGNMIERKNMTSSELLLDLNAATGVYLVEVTGGNKTFTKKVFIGK